MANSAVSSTLAVPQAAANRRERWGILFVLSLLYIFSFIDRQIITMLVPDIKASLGLTDVEMGLILGPAFSICYAIFGLPLGWAADRYSRRLVILIGVLLFGLATASSAFAVSFATLFAARLFVGIGEASLSPAAYSLMGDVFPRREIGTATAIYNMSAKLGIASAYAVGGVILTFSAVLTAYFPTVGITEAWRWAFIVTAIPTILASLLVLTFREPVRDVRFSLGHLDPETMPFSTYLWTNKRLIFSLLIGFSVIAAVSFGISSWAPTYLFRAFGWKPIQYGPLLGAISLAAAVGLLLVGRGADWLSDRKGREYHLAIYLAVLAVAVPISILAFTTQSPTIFMICFMGLQLIGLIGAVILFPVLQDAVPPHLRGRVIGLYLMLSTLIGYSLGPLSIALATDYLFRDEGAVGYSMALLAAVGFPLAIVVLNLARHPIRAVTVTCGMRDPNVGQ